MLFIQVLGIIRAKGKVEEGEGQVIYYHLSCPDTGSRGLRTSHPVSGRACGPKEDVTHVYVLPHPSIYYLTVFAAPYRDIQG